MAEEKKPVAKRLGGLNSGPGAGRLGECYGGSCASIFNARILRRPPPCPPHPHDVHAASAGSLRSGDGAGPSTGAAGAGATAGGARKVRCCCLPPLPRRQRHLPEPHATAVALSSGSPLWPQCRLGACHMEAHCMQMKCMHMQLPALRACCEPCNTLVYCISWLHLLQSARQPPSTRALMGSLPPFSLTSSPSLMHRMSHCAFLPHLPSAWPPGPRQPLPSPLP